MMHVGPTALGRRRQPSARLLSFILLEMVATLLTCLSALGPATPAWAQGRSTVRPDPGSAEIPAGTTAEVTILVEGVTDLYGFEFEVTFDPTLLEVVDADPSVEGVQVGAGGFLSPDWVLKNAVDNEEGTIAYAVSQRSPSAPMSGDGVLAVITWRAKASGTSPVAVTHLLLAAPHGVAIPATPQEGEIVIGSSEAAPAATSMPTQTPTPVPTTPRPASTPVPPTVTRASTSMPSTPTQQATAVSDTAEIPTLAPTSTRVRTSRSTVAPSATSTSPGTPTRVHTSPTSMPATAAMEPTSTSADQPQPTAEDASLPSSRLVSSSDASGISRGILIYVALACLVAGVGAIGAALLLSRRK